MTDADLIRVFTTPDVACDRTTQVWDAVHGNLDRDALRDLLAHVRTCGTCAHAWSLARQAVDAQTAPIVLHTSRSRRALAIGAAVTALAAAALLVARPALFPADPYAGQSTWRAADGLPLALGTPDGAAVSPGDPLTWAAIDGATYTVTFTTTDLRPLATVHAGDHAATSVPALPAGAALWQVQATVDGLVVATRTGRLEVR